MNLVQKLIAALVLFKIKTFKYRLAFLAIVSSIALYRTLKEYNENSEKFLSIHGEEVVFTVINSTNENDSIQFQVENIQKPFFIPKDTNISIMEGEHFIGKLALERNEFFKVELSKQRVYNLNNYQKVNAEVIEIYKNRNKTVKFKYTINNKTFVRTQYVKHISDYHIGQNLIAQINKNKPQIGYVEIYRIFPK